MVRKLALSLHQNSKTVTDMKLFKFNIKTYWFGIYRYTKYVYADSEESAKECIRNWSTYRNDEDAQIESVEEIDLDDKTNRII